MKDSACLWTAISFRSQLADQPNDALVAKRRYAQSAHMLAYVSRQTVLFVKKAVDRSMSGAWLNLFTLT